MDVLILTIAYDEHKQLAELFPNTQIINLDDLKSLEYFVEAKCIAIVVDADSMPPLALTDLTKTTTKYQGKIIYTSTSREVIKYLKNYGNAVLKTQDLIAEQILKIYSELVQQNHGSYIFDYENRTITNAKTTYKIQNTPFLILSHLVKNKNKVCSRDELLEAVYSYEIDHDIPKINKLSDVRRVDVHIHNLRKTIPDQRIKTVINEGYVYEDLEKPKKNKGR